MSRKHLYFILVSVFVVLGALALSEAKVSPEDSDLTKEELVETVEEENPEVALEKLKEEARLDPYVSRSCHYIGRATYNKYQDLNESWSYIDGYCSGGYIHGNLHEYFEQRETFPENFDTCSQFEEESRFRWDCSHGSGNAFVMFTDNNLSRSINLCEREFESSFQKEACANGAYVQHFRNIPSELSNSSYSYPDDTFETCSQTKSQYRMECYQYVDDYFHENDVSNIFEMSQKCANVGNNTMSQKCLENVYKPYMYEMIFEVSKYTAGLNLITSLG